MKKYRNVREKGGFTLVELVVVIAIIAILAAIAIPMVAGLINNATKTSDKVAANEIDKACMEYKTGIIWGIINQTEKNHSRRFAHRECQYCFQSVCRQNRQSKKCS